MYQIRSNLSIIMCPEIGKHPYMAAGVNTPWLHLTYSMWLHSSKHWCGDRLGFQTQQLHGYMDP